MRTFLVLSVALLQIVAVVAGESQPAPAVRHELTIEIDPAGHALSVADRLVLPQDRTGRPVEFLLNEALTVQGGTPSVERVPLGDYEGFFGINGTSAGVSEQVRLARYRIEKVPADGVVELRYSGKFDFGLSDQKEEYTRGFRETAGIVGEDGVYLAGSGFWYPYFDDALIRFTMDVGIPPDWHVISQGAGVSRGPDGRARWDSQSEMDEIYIVGGALTRYAEAAGAVEASVLLREPDDALADKYLTATAQYIEMYRELIGPYPYGKFALVENFWETGYGMPSFTLLGPTVIRFPFILHSSYPHEILHNWWGNSVFVDYPTGNWCEGLTAYLADHLIQEQRDRGVEYRRTALQKYRNFVRDGSDFPLTEFRSRHSAATEAVGYGKTLMVFHMLRLHVGDDVFRDALARFYRTHRGRRASFADVQSVFEKASGEELAWFFDPWVTRTGAPALTLEGTGVRRDGDLYVVRGTLRQTAGPAPYRLEVPVAVSGASSVEVATVAMDGAEQSFEIRTAEPPSTLEVDAGFDLFRLLDPREIPPSIGQIFGESRILLVLPSAAPSEQAALWAGLVTAWTSDSHAIDTRLDSELEALPSDRSVWIAGRSNRFAREAFGESVELGMTWDRDALMLDEQRIPLAGHSAVVVRRHPANPEKAVGLLAVDPAAAFAGLARKLPHYGKYSYVAFEGDEPTNIAKGQWPASGSPLRVDLRPEADRGRPLSVAKPERREPLADVPPVFSGAALERHVAYLASEKLEGRGLGSPGLAAATSYVVEQFEAAGLRPGGDDGTWSQRFSVPDGPAGRPVEATNVIGVLPGSRQDWDGRSVIVSAHLDHLGRGWPDVHEGDAGKIHPGADDNASGVAVLLELARNMGSAGPLSRSVVFVAFTAEEAGRLGSRYYVEHPTPFPLDGALGAINLDTVGRLGDGKISVLATSTASEWPHIFRGVGFVTGVESRNVSTILDASDQMSFIASGVPAVQIFTGAHGDYHRPGDTVDEIDTDGMVRVATFVKEALVYMGERDEPFQVTIDEASTSAAPPPSAGPPRSGRKVRIGTVPDFSYPGPGAKVESVSAGSPAERAGLLAGDVLVTIGGQDVPDLRGYSDVLKSLEPGQTVEVVVQRGGERLVKSITVEAR